MFMLVAQLVLSVLLTLWTSIERGLSGARGGLRVTSQFSADEFDGIVAEVV